MNGVNFEIKALIANLLNLRILMTIPEILIAESMILILDIIALMEEEQ